MEDELGSEDFILAMRWQPVEAIQCIAVAAHEASPELDSSCTAVPAPLLLPYNTCWRTPFTSTPAGSVLG